MQAKSVLGFARRTLSRIVMSWRSPADQPRWARPLILAVAGIAGLSYGWSMSNDVLEPFYAAAARSMSMSWRNYFFGAFDPAGTITIDKLPGELWIQALLIRFEGLQTWTIVLPQVIEGALAVLVLYRAVRRLAGPLAGLLAGVVLAASPVTIELNRGNVSDSLLVLLLVCAADAASNAIATERIGPLVLSGGFVGLAFQAKMTEAWLLLPAIGLAYLVVRSRSFGRDAKALGVFLLTAVVVSLSWMTIVSLVPGHDRPYVDASRNNSEFEQVFLYNGFLRFGSQSDLSSLGPSAPFIAASTATDPNFATSRIGPAWNRLLHGPFGEEDGWLLPTAVVALVGLGILGRRRQATERAAMVLWGSWFVIFFVAFSVGRQINTYYMAALSPPVAALCGMGIVALKENFSRLRVRLLASLTVVASVGYSIFLVPAHAGARTWLVGLLIALGVLSLLSFGFSVLTRGHDTRVRYSVLVLSFVAVMCAPIAASVVVVANGLGPFDYPFESQSVRVITQVDPRNALDSAYAAAPFFEGWFYTPNAVVATETSGLAQLPIFVTGEEFMPIGGLLGSAPVPSLSEIEHLIATKRLTTALIAIRPANPDPRLSYIRHHCRLGEHLSSSQPHAPIFGLYTCVAEPLGND